MANTYLETLARLASLRNAQPVQSSQPQGASARLGDVRTIATKTQQPTSSFAPVDQQPVFEPMLEPRVIDRRLSIGRNLDRSLVDQGLVNPLRPITAGLQTQVSRQPVLQPIPNEQPVPIPASLNREEQIAQALALLGININLLPGNIQTFNQPQSFDAAQGQFVPQSFLGTQQQVPNQTNLLLGLLTNMLRNRR